MPQITNPSESRTGPVPVPDHSFEEGIVPNIQPVHANLGTFSP